MIFSNLCRTTAKPRIYIIIWFRLSVCMYVCMYVCLFVRMLFPHSAKTNGPIFKIQMPIIRV